MEINPALLKTFQDFQKLNKKDIIKNPDDLVFSGFSIIKRVADIIGAQSFHLFFTRKSLKHLAEKRGSTIFLEILPQIIYQTEKIYKGKIPNRFLLSKTTDDESQLTFAVALELSKKNILVITVFRTDSDYLKNFEILWRTGAP